MHAKETHDRTITIRGAHCRQTPYRHRGHDLLAPPTDEKEKAKGEQPSCTELVGKHKLIEKRIQIKLEETDCYNSMCWACACNAQLNMPLSLNSPTIEQLPTALLLSVHACRQTVDTPSLQVPALEPACRAKLDSWRPDVQPAPRDYPSEHSDEAESLGCAWQALDLQQACINGVLRANHMSTSGEALEG